MEDGPILGSIFKAPPYTARSSDCVGAAKSVSQPTETMQQPSSAVLLQPAYIIHPKEQMVSSPGPKCNCQAQDENVGTSHIITQPKEFMPDNDNNEWGDSTGRASDSPSWRPKVMQLLSHQLSQPLLGIPQAIQTMSQTPPMSDLMAAPRLFINSFIQRLNKVPNEAEVSHFLVIHVGQKLV